MSDQPTIRIGICGLGTVGQGVWKHLARPDHVLDERLGAKLVLHRASIRDPKKKRSVRLPASKLTTDPMAVATDPKIQIVCELLGGTTLAREVTLAALRLGKTVVSANKALLCEHGPALFAAARQHGGHYLFEASVAGGIPIIKALREGLVANRFGLIYGILNGTCNYILTRMEREGLSYPAILKEAKALGYAEADESLDVDGWDTAHKASILAYLAHGSWVSPKSMNVEGIAAITQSDIAFARDQGFAIKLLAIIQRDFATDELSVRVQPTLLPRTSVLANVNEVYNGISVTGDGSGRHGERGHQRHRGRRDFVAPRQLAGTGSRVAELPAVTAGKNHRSLLPAARRARRAGGARQDRDRHGAQSREHRQCAATSGGTRGACLAHPDDARDKRESHSQHAYSAQTLGQCGGATAVVAYRRFYQLILWPQRFLTLFSSHVSHRAKIRRHLSR